MQRRALTAEFIGTGFLLIGVIGSGIMAERLSDDVGLQLLENAAATAGVLYMIIVTFGPVSGAHFNPAVTLADAALGGRRWSTVPSYVVAQIAGGAAGVMIANLMFDLDAVTWSTKERTGGGLWLGEVVAIPWSSSTAQTCAAYGVRCVGSLSSSSAMRRLMAGGGGSSTSSRTSSGGC